MRGLFAIILIILSGVTSIDAQLLSTRGKAIVNESGDTVILRGMGLGGWMLQEGYMFRVSNLGQQYKIKEKISEVVGAEKTKEFYERWLQNHTTKADIDSLASWGFNSIRLPMHFNLYTLPVDEEPVKGSHTWIEKGFAMTDTLLEWCKSNKLWLILDLHAAPGGQGNDLPISDRNPAKPSLWESEENKQKTIALWKKLAERYANEPWIGGYDIINEPNWGFEDPKDVRGTAENKNEPLRQLMVDITKAIREVDKKHLIIIEGNGFGNNYRGILPGWDSNTVLSFHKYGNFNNRDAIKNFLSLRDQYNMPLWLGESGENSNTWFTDAIGLVEQNGIGWAWWQGKKMGINNPLEIKRPAGYDKLLAYWSGKGEKPTEAEAWKTLEELLANIHISNNIYHPDVVDAMIRQVTTTATIPFKQNILSSAGLTIEAADFDMGRQRHAYYDTDTARYQYTPGVNTDGNRGHSYRNDGVDIKRSADGPYIFNIEDGEWLQYTFSVKDAGRYDIGLTVADTTGAAVITLIHTGKEINVQHIEKASGPEAWTHTAMSNFLLPAGINVIKIKAVKGGYNFRAIQFFKAK
jgi:aryl-phospho-beta-D-glucosidase BglC (GH1 family)